MKGIIFLAGGGNQEKSRNIDALFSKHVKKILYIPNAINTKKFPYDSCKAFVSGCLPTVDIDLRSDLGELEHLDLSAYDGVYLGGGSTPKLLYILKSINFFVKLKAFWENGGHVYGGSAGAIVLGDSIRSSEKGKVHLPIDTVGGNLVAATVWPHYKPEDTITLDGTVIVIPEDGGVMIQHDKMICVGDCFILHDGQKKNIRKVSE